MNASHTEDQPPKGVEVIGDLPPGTAWWDAEELVFIYNRPLQMKLAIILIGLGLFLIWVVGQGNGDTVSGPGAMGFALFLLALGLIGLIIANIKRPLFRINGNVLTTQYLIARTNSIFDLREYRALDYVPESRGTGCLYFVVSPLLFQFYTVKWAVLVPNDRTVPHNYSMDGILLGHVEYPPLNFQVFLSYRIAKVKGENPPPPEFL